MRIDQHDSERTHFDIRELVWLHVADNWELHTGISKVFWGVNEANHLVDIINQDDQVDEINGDPKLGQPMINLSLIQDWGTLDFFVLPYFRERTFSGKTGRFRANFLVDTDHAEYESSKKDRHIDFALRWNHTIGDYDIGLYYFSGTNRDPFFIPRQNKHNEWVLIPYYNLINQIATDIQLTQGAWLWKFEGLYRKNHQSSDPVKQLKLEDFAALSGGFEYTFFGLMDSNTDLGILMEYSWDEREDPMLSQFQNDLMLGIRIGLNDTQDTQFLAGFLQDLNYSQLRTFQIEASRRLGDDWKINMELRLFSNHQYNPIAQDDYFQLSLEKYF